jgi:signal transduction histidine kinase
MVGKISHELRTPLNNIRIMLQVAISYIGLTKEFIEEYLQPAL